MAQDLEQLTQWADGLLESLSASSRQTLARQIAKDLRAENQRRMTAQTAPDGTPFAPRKPQLKTRAMGQKRLRNRMMFKKLRLDKYLKVRASASAAVVEFAGAVQRIAQVHHHGLRDRVQKSGKGPEVAYTARPLIGINEQDTQRITDLILGHLSRQ